MTRSLKSVAVRHALEKRPQGGPRWLEDLRVARRREVRRARHSRPSATRSGASPTSAPLGRDRFRAGRADLRRRRAAARLRLHRRAAAPGHRQRPLRHDAVARPRGCPPACTPARSPPRSSDHADVVQRYFGQLADFSSRSFAALNTAFVQDGAFVHVPDGVGARAADPHRVRVGSRGVDGDVASAHADRRRRRSQARIVESYVGAAGADLLHQRRLRGVRRRERQRRSLQGAAGIARRVPRRQPARPHRAQLARSRRTRSRSAASSSATTPSRCSTARAATAR